MLPDPTAYPLDHLTLRGAPGDYALKTRTRSLTYAELEQQVAIIAFSLAAKELKCGDRVATWLNKSELACLMPLAAARAGLVHVPINPVLRHGQVAHILNDSGARLLITTLERLAVLQRGDLPAGCIVVDATQLAAVEGVLPPSSHHPDLLAALLYTSGSTGLPKGVMLSHANLWLGAVSVAHYLQLTPEDKLLALLPLSFDYGQNQLFSAWAAGACVVPLDYLNALEVVRTVQRQQITTIAGVPPLWTQLVETSWPAATCASLKRLTNSGGALTATLITQMRKTFGAADIYAMYGLTEAFRSTYLIPELLATHPSSIGTAIPFAEVLVVRPDGTCAAAGEAGELVHAGRLVAQGYWHDAARTAARFRAAPDWSREGGIAVWSGDMVVANAEGLLTFVARDDEMIKTSGNRVSPTEIEAVALASGIVAEAVAFGRADPRLGAVIILVARPSGELKIADAQLRAYLKTELPLFMQPHEIHWRKSLPRNANGKFDRAALKAEFCA